MFKYSINIIVLGSILIGFSGCGAKESQFKTFKKPTDGKGMLYVYRPSKFTGGGVYYDVKDATNNDAVIGTLNNGTFIKQQMTPGTKNIWARTAMFKEEANVEIKEGEVSCVRGSVTTGLLIGNPELATVDLKTCELEIKDTQEAPHTESENYDKEFFKNKTDLNTTAYTELPSITVEKNANMFNICATLSSIALNELEYKAKELGADAIIDLKWDGEVTKEAECSRYWGWYLPPFLPVSWFVPGTLDATVSGTPIKFKAVEK